MKDNFCIRDEDQSATNNKKGDEAHSKSHNKIPLKGHVWFFEKSFKL